MEKLQEVARYIRQITPENAILLTFHTYVAIESRRNVLHGLEMSVFSYDPRLSTEQCVYYHVINDALLKSAIQAQKADLLIFTDASLKLIGLCYDSKGHLRPLPSVKRPSGIHKVMEQKYRLVRRFYPFGQWQDTLYIYLPQ